MRKDFYDSLEVDNPDLRERELLGRLPDLVALALSAPGWARHLGSVDINSMTSRQALARLPVLRAEARAALRAADPPFGGLLVSQRGRVRRLLMSPGPLFHPDSEGKDWWGAARAMFAAGQRPGDTVLNCFSHHSSPFGFMMDAGAWALGATVIAAGSHDAIAIAEVMRLLQPTGFVGSPAFLKRLYDIAGGRGGGAVSIRHALVADAPLAPELRADLAEAGIAAQQCLAHPDIGVIAYESDALDGLIVNEGLIAEVVRPGGNEPVAAGETGELVVTSFNPDYPMIRLATGWRGAALPGRSPCGRTNMRIADVVAG